MFSQKFLILFLVVYLYPGDSDAQKHKKFFRKDYLYFDATQSFYKVHTVHRTWFEAKKICVNEGATLFYPEDQAEANLIVGHINETHGFYWIYIGISDLVAEGVFETIDGRPIIDVYSNWGGGEPNNSNDIEDCVIIRRETTLNDDRCNASFPFVCKKTLASIEWNKECHMPYLNYVYNEHFGRCYKFHSNPANWTDAHAICATEQSYLAVINSQVEADHLVALTNRAPKNKPGNYIRGAVFLGFHNQLDEGWTTVRGTSLEDSGYDYWATEQPDGGDAERCGSMFHNGRLNDIACDLKCFFICEHEVETVTNILDDRIKSD